MIRKLSILVQMLWLESNKRNLGVLQAKPKVISVLYGCVGMMFNINHLGSVYATRTASLGISYLLEKEVIELTKRLFNINQKNIEGYITGGGTESNIFMMWSLREMLNAKNKQRTCVIVSPFTHYSVLKAARMLNIEIIYTRVNTDTWSIDANGLASAITQAVKKTYEHILVPVTLGYSSLGTSDPLLEIDRVLTRTNAMYSKIRAVGWIDAASQGIPLALLQDTFIPFACKNMYGILIDFHKLGDAPIPGGIVLFKKTLRASIQRDIGYLAEPDVTVSGSRPGFAALSIWASLYGQTLPEWKNRLLDAEECKNAFINELKQSLPGCIIIHSHYSLTCAIVINSYFKKLPDQLEKKYNLYMCGIQLNDSGSILKHYKVHITPYTKKKVLREFIRDISEFQIGKN